MSDIVYRDRGIPEALRAKLEFEYGEDADKILAAFERTKFSTALKGTLRGAETDTEPSARIRRLIFLTCFLENEYSMISL